MALQKVSASEPSEMSGFVIVDLDDAPTADGVVRSAKKILQDGARTMARSRTYAWALLGQQISGASAGVSVAPEDHDAGMKVFVEAVLDRVAAGELSLDPAKGVSPADLEALHAVDRRSAVRDAPRAHGSLADELLATGALAAAGAVGGGLDGQRVAVEGAGHGLPALVAALAKTGATLVALGTSAGTLVEPTGLDPTSVIDAYGEHGDRLTGALGSDLPPPAILTQDADVLVCGSRLGLIDHDVAGTLAHRLIVPIGPVPVTAKGLAVATRREIVVLPDFLTTSGPLHAFRPADGATADQLLALAADHASSLTAALLDHPEGPLLGACLRAEDFLRTWQEQLPFGRPLA